jgi:hypothetical protein
MTRVLLFDSDPNHADDVVRSLRGSCQVIVCCSFASTLTALRNAGFDILILAGLGAQDWKRGIDSVQEAVGRQRSSPRVICLSRTYRGPQERLEIERKGGRLVYER